MSETSYKDVVTAEVTLKQALMPPPMVPRYKDEKGNGL